MSGEQLERESESRMVFIRQRAHHSNIWSDIMVSLVRNETHGKRHYSVNVRFSCDCLVRTGLRFGDRLWFEIFRREDVDRYTFHRVEENDGRGMKMAKNVNGTGNIRRALGDGEQAFVFESSTKQLHGILRIESSVDGEFVFDVARMNNRGPKDGR